MTPRRRPPITDPRVRELVRAARTPRGGHALSRRSFLLGAVGAAGMGALLAACGSDGEEAVGVVDRSAQDRLVRWANWPIYVDQDESGASPTISAFEDLSGIRVDYAEAIEDNESFYATVQDRLLAGSDIGYDVVTVTDYLAARLIRLGYAQSLDRTRIPNAENLRPSLRGVDFDFGRTRSLTWQSGFAGIAWDKEAVRKGLRTVSDLWAPELAGRVQLLSEMRDTMGLLMLEEGIDPSGDWSNDEFYQALEVMREKVSSGHVREVSGNSYTDALVSGEAVAVFAWSGDITALNFEHGDRFEFAIPEAGGTLWSDNLLVPVGSTHRSNAEDLFDYYYQPEVAAQVAAWVNYITPVEGAQEAMVAIDPELAENPMIFPDDETLKRVSVFRTLEPDEDERFSNEFFAAAGL
ncbi:spermidine/putrescine ABC transporter substrate-binding protein [Cellulomonas cellasea]|uniref:ABC transporter substrate-binding protein n=1 Tax=Cellulomonas cellasea TaxID=43670 RepID=UPI0025A33E86|nr:spermidine/putrescine ABC transporter substrate-binding protein [Cellulomonas cellasea]MDM8083530.1 spermidine/putrescine ABC transporter substrate-binding protein [Cellulomonas cellasea]